MSSRRGRDKGLRFFAAAIHVVLHVVRFSDEDIVRDLVHLEEDAVLIVGKEVSLLRSVPVACVRRAVWGHVVCR